ncbi:hypothetical protein EV421DRAFT_1907366 [Armillaria borealis]|uniref:Uncharacterized protein n=1 Tax=Armillaria borealis TaxID=47425 RepID=A0AA39JAV9_9AGAR|nr:hypothetical protein EV421DRAFT_1907366 [Armillaria borealis]
MKRLFAGTRSLADASLFVHRYHVLVHQISTRVQTGMNLSLKKVAKSRTRLPQSNCPTLPLSPTLKAPGMDMGDLYAFFRESADMAPLYYFDQLIDHDVPSKETFKQRYWRNTELSGPIMQAKSMRPTGQSMESSHKGSAARQYGASYRGSCLLRPERRDNGDSVGPDNVPWILLPRWFSQLDDCQHPDMFLDRVDVVSSRSSRARLLAILRTACQGTVPPTSKPSSSLALMVKIQSIFGFNSSNLALAEAQLQPATGSGAAFYRFCDALEVKDGVSASVNGWGVDHALSAWARWSNPDTPLERPSRISFLALVEGGIVSRFNSDLQACVVEFPDAFHPEWRQHQCPLRQMGRQKQKAVLRQWRRLSAVNSTAVSTYDQPIGLSNGFHCTDLVMTLAGPDPMIVAVQDLSLDYVEKWLAK